MMAARKPIREVKDHTWKESSLRDAEQEAYNREACLAGDHGGQARQDSPGDHDPRDPNPGADLFKDHVARHLEDEIAPVEHADRKPEGPGRHIEIAAHRESGEAHIDAIDVGKNVRKNRKWEQAQVDFAHRRSFERANHCFLPGFMASRAYAE